MSKKAKLSLSSDSGSAYDDSESYSGSDDFADILDDVKPKRKIIGGDDHPDRDPDDEAEESDGPNDVDTDGEFDAVTHEELADTDDDEDENEDEDDNSGADDGDGGGGDDEDYSVKSKKCYLSGLDSNSIVIDDDSNIYKNLVPTMVPNDRRKTGPDMTIYELARIIGTRAQQFNRGAPPLIDGVDEFTPTQKAYVELLTKQNPMIVQRRLPNKEYEEWKTEELNIIHILTDEYFLPPEFDIKAFEKKYLK